MEWHRRVVEASAGGLWVIDLEGRTLEANTAAAALLGVARDELIGRRTEEFLDEAGREQLAAHLSDLREGRSNAEAVECRFERADGTHVWALVREALLLDDDGRTVVLLNVDDISTRKRLYDDLRHSQRQRVEAERVARFGSWEWDPADGSFTWSEGLARVYGNRVATVFENMATFYEAVHPDDRGRVDIATQRVLDGEQSAEFEARVHAERGYIWIYCRGVAVRDAEGELVSIIGTHLDVTQVRDTDDALRDMIKQHDILKAVASRANEAATLIEVLRDARALVLLHDDWDRARAFEPTEDGAGLALIEDEEEPELDVAQRERAAAERCLRERRPVWDDEVRLTLAFPVFLNGEVLAVLTITSLPPLYRHDLIESMTLEVAGQLTRVAEREATNRELAEARDRALEASELKSAFLSSMSHEIRTPLNGVIGLTELMGRTELDEQQRHLVTGIDFSSRSLLAIINDVLDFSKIEAGHLHLEEVDFEVREVLDQVVGMLDHSARARDLELTVWCGPDVPAAASGDPTKLAQVLTNLVSNAVKFTPSGQVTVRATTEDDDGQAFLAVEVRDTGVGVPPHRLETIFEAFSQADTSINRHYGGTGLGLAISKEIVEAMGGRMGVESTPGTGSRFWFRVPLHPPSGADPVEDLVVARATVDRLRALVLDGAYGAGSGVVDELTRWDVSSLMEAPPLPQRLLVVEDNPVNQIVTTGFLAGLGYAADTADNGLEALAMTATTDYDLVLMDVQMPGIDGYTTTGLLREREVGQGRPRTPVVALTASAVEGERGRALAAGLDDFLTKPVTSAAIAAIVARWVHGDEADPAAPVSPPPSMPTAPADPAPTGVHGRVLDLARLADLADLPGGDVYVRRALESFLAKAPALHAAVRDAADPAQLSAAAHSLKGSAANLGLVVVGKAAAVLEAAGRLGAPTDPAQLEDLALALAAGTLAIEDHLRLVDDQTASCDVTPAG